MSSETSWRTVVPAVVAGTIVVGIGRLVLYEVLAGEFMAAQSGNSLFPVWEVASFTYWDGAAPLIATGLVAAAIAKRADPKLFIALAFAVETLLAVLTSVLLAPIEPLGRAGTVTITAYELAASAAAIGLGVWLAHRRSQSIWLGLAALLALTPLLKWLWQLLLYLNIGELGLLDVVLAIAPVAAPVACLAVAARGFGSRLPPPLGGRPVRGWMAIPLAAGLAWWVRLPLQVVEFFPQSPVRDAAVYFLHSPVFPSTTLVTIVCAVLLAARWRSDAPHRSVRTAQLYLFALVVSVAYRVWTYDAWYVVSQLWSEQAVAGVPSLVTW